jgi:peroxiredoxin
MAGQRTPDRVDLRKLTTVTGRQIVVPDPDRLIHLQFRRFAGCPICNLHLQSFAARHDEITAARVQEVVFFHSSAADLYPHTADLPFAVIADPTKRYYREFGVESNRHALLHPRAAAAAVRGSAATLRGRYSPPALFPAGGRLGLPADFLIDPQGRVLASKYGTHAFDQWSVDELLARAAAAQS